MMDKIYLFIENIILKVGFEIHVQLNTLNKLFSKETYNLNKKSNSLTGEYTLGLPGSLPVFNVNALIKSLYAVNLFNCKCSSIVGFDRKNYFYSDLVKGYQITQKYKPIGLFGYIEFFSMYRNVLKKITIRDIHIEEDVGVISNYFLFNNFNRSGVSLLEFVTEPIQFEGYFNPNELNLFLRCLFNQLKYLNISNCELQSGNVRLDVNISATLRNFNQVLNIIEVKNLNSIDSAFKCIFFELRRQIFLTRKNIPKLEYHTRN
ncbi:hypothetical protein E5P55_01045 [Candidatus Pinguicoccus supinus]|uniref:Aspartyl/Glutamyl-tRNA(Gln) amidotransferase subunit B/E catalytic domain-containing protein n=1 Tax=Candidatus Pinguicoccus supinus TaxID=2529394 RepID=A0A7T0FY41_9BACT|nr:hypothetical protein E5P55_01045 [Candidatus Pinguicoccus supinus]